MVEVSTEDIGGVMDGEAGPVELAAVCRWCIKDELQFRDAFGRSTDAKDASRFDSFC